MKSQFQKLNDDPMPASEPGSSESERAGRRPNSGRSRRDNGIARRESLSAKSVPISVTKTIDPEKLYAPKIAALLMDMSESWLAKRRQNGDGPPYVKQGRSVKYQGLDLIEYRKSKKRRSTSEP